MRALQGLRARESPQISRCRPSEPEIARDGSRQSSDRAGEGPRPRLPPGRLGSSPGVVEEEVDLGEREAGELDVELEIDEGLQLDREDIAVPAGVQRELVVGDHVGPALRRAQVGQPERRHALQAEQLGGLDPAVTGDDLVLIADQDRVGEAEALDASAICLICFLEWVRALRA